MKPTDPYSYAENRANQNAPRGYNIRGLFVYRTCMLAGTFGPGGCCTLECHCHHSSGPVAATDGRTVV
jgi:hypothetical protein